MQTALNHPALAPTSVPSTKAHLNPVEQLFLQMDRRQRREYVREFYRECNRFPGYMKAEPMPDGLPAGTILGIWRSRDHLCTAWPSTHPGVIARLSINRAQIDETTGSWLPGISWDELWLIKNQCGYADYDAVEVHPAVDKLVNDQNMRHLWVMKDRISFGLHAAQG